MSNLFFLRSLTFSDSVQTFSAFVGNTHLTELTFPDSVTSMGWMAMEQQPTLRSVVLGNRITSIFESTFDSDTNLEHVTIGNAVTYIGEKAFYKCANLVDLKIPDSVRYIDDSALSGLLALTTVVLPASLTYLGDYSFYMAQRLTMVHIPNSVTHIGDGSLNSCLGYGLAVGEGSTSQLRGDVRCVPCVTDTLVIPDVVTSIGLESFFYCINVSTVIISDSVTGNIIFSCARDSD